MTSNATSWSAAVLLTALVSGCAATPPSAAAPHAEPAAPKAPAKTPAKGSSRVATITPTLEPQAVYEQTRDETGRVAVSPTAVDLAAMPVVALPEPLKADEAPSALPPSKGEPGLEIEKIDSGWRARGTEGNAVYVVIEEPLARLQIGTVAPNRSATSRVYRTCGDHYYEKPMLTPARWETVIEVTIPIMSGARKLVALPAKA